MQTQFTQRNIETTNAARRSHKLSTCLQLAAVRTNRRPMRISFPVPRRESCLTRRALRAALRDAEFHEWLTTGDDFLDALHHPLR